MSEKKLESIDLLEIEPLSDEALETVAGGKSSDGPRCCSCHHCSTRGDADGDVEGPVATGEG